MLQAPECTLVHDPPAPWDHVYTLENVVPALEQCRAPLVRSSDGILQVESEVNRSIDNASRKSRAREAYHNLQDDDIMKNIFNSGRNKNKVGMRILAWMITEEIKLTEHYKMYAEVFELDVPLTQSQPTESTQGMHRTTSAPRSPNPATEPAESSVPKRSTMIHFRLPSRQSTRLTPPVPVPTAEKADEMILQDMIQVSLAEQKSREEQEARENVALVYEHLAAEEIEKLVEDPENSDKESLKVEIVQEKEKETTKDMEVEPDKDTPMVDVSNIVPPVNVA
ncbi:hypothetical protein Tco_0092369 [Tanacetum coccineum]